MRLREIYEECVRAGIEADARERSEIDNVLEVARKEYDKLDAADKPFFDLEKLTNPYSDTRICAGDPDAEVRGMLVGVDMETAEVLLADRLREKGAPIDLIFAHHPEGPGHANLHEVMYMQADLWAVQGVSIAAGDALIAPRAEEIRRRVMPANHYRAIHAAELLGFASLSCHTPADNSVNAFVQRYFDERSPRTLDEVVKALREIPEYADGAQEGLRPHDRPGSPTARAGRMVVDMTGGTEGPTDALDRLSAAGVGTLVGMHYSEDHRKRAEELKLNLVIAGHISSDVLGMNLILDEIEKLGAVEIVCTSGMVRVKRVGLFSARCQPPLWVARCPARQQRCYGVDRVSRWIHAGRRFGRRSVGLRLDGLRPLRDDQRQLRALDLLADDGALGLVRVGVLDGVAVSAELAYCLVERPGR